MSYTEFWDFYLKEHSHPWTKRLHVLGTALGLALALYGIAISSPWLLPTGLGTGYGFAWFSHFIVEKNKPATWRYPFWSFISDFRMFFCYVTGRL